MEIIAYANEVIKKYNEFVGDESSKCSGSDIPEYMLHSEKKNASFFFGTRAVEYAPKQQTISYVGKPKDRDGHVLVVGGAGSGKSSCIAIPTLETWGGMIFAVDIKGELSEKWVNVRKENSRVKIFGFDKNRGILSTYDPFYLLDKDDDDLVQNVREIAQAIIPLLPNTIEPFWTLAAQNVLTAALLYGFNPETKDEDGNDMSMSFNATISRIQSVPIWELIAEISGSGNKPAKMYVNQFSGIENPEDNKMLAGISAELSNKVMVFATDMRIRSAFEPSDDMMNWDDLKSHNIFMRIPEDKLGQWDGAITLMITQLIRTLERRPDIYSKKGKEKNLPPILLLLDEFPRLGKVDAIQNAVSTLRSKGVTICLMMQSLAQLDRTYGKETRQIIVDNCQYKAILNVTDPENQKIFSDMVGTVRVTTRSVSEGIGGSVGLSSGSNVGEDISYSDGKSKGRSDNHSVSIGTTREPIIHPHEFATLEDIVLMTPEGFCLVDKAPYYPDSKTKKQLPPLIAQLK